MSIKITDATGTYVLTVNTSSEVAVENYWERRLLEEISDTLSAQNKLLDSIANVLNNGNL